MENFNFYAPTFFAFGKGRESDCGELVKKFGGSKVLIHYGGGSVVRSGLLDRVTDSLEKAGVKLLTLTNYEAVLEVALQTGYINEEDIPVLNAWRKDPAQWGK